LTPVLEKVADDYAGKGVILKKINVDENKFIAAQFRIQSIPTVYAMFQGQPVADLTNARTEAQLKGLLDQILRQLPVEGEDAAAEHQVEPLLAMGEEVLGNGEAERAIGIFAQIIEIAPTSAAAHGGLIRALTAAGMLDEAEAALADVPVELAKDMAIGQARSGLELARNAPPSSELVALINKVSATPDDHQARLDLALAQVGAGQRDEAADNLLHIIAVDRGWNDGEARTRLLALFEAVGLEDSWVKTQRRRLSDILFG
jgi:putative thioredoxin